MSSASARATARARSVLPVPGTSSTRTWPSARSAVRIRRSGVSPPTTARPTAPRRSSHSRRAPRSTPESSRGAAGGAAAAAAAGEGGSISVSVAGSSGGRGSREGYARGVSVVQPTPASSGPSHAASRRGLPTERHSRQVSGPREPRHAGRALRRRSGNADLRRTGSFVLLLASGAEHRRNASRTGRSPASLRHNARRPCIGRPGTLAGPVSRSGRIARLLPDDRPADVRSASFERDGTNMSRWWNAFTGLLARRRNDRIVARRLRMYVGTTTR